MMKNSPAFRVASATSSTQLVRLHALHSSLCIYPAALMSSSTGKMSSESTSSRTSHGSGSHSPSLSSAAVPCSVHYNPITPSEVYTTLMKISDSDLHLLRLSDEYARPEWMILTVLPVPPPPVRPSIAVDGGTMRSHL